MAQLAGDFDCAGGVRALIYLDVKLDGNDVMMPSGAGSQAESSCRSR